MSRASADTHHAGIESSHHIQNIPSSQRPADTPSKGTARHRRRPPSVRERLGHRRADRESHRSTPRLGTPRPSGILPSSRPPAHRNRRSGRQAPVRRSQRPARNFYEDWRTSEAVAEALGDVERFVSKLEPLVLSWTLRISSGVSKGIYKSVVQSDREFLRIGVGDR